MTLYGVTPAGFVKKLLGDIKTEIEAAFTSIFGAGFDLSAESPEGQFIGVVAERESLLWDVGEGIYSSRYPDTAEDVSLDNAVALTGITRKQATASKVLGAFFFGTPTTVIPAGTQVSVAGNATSIFTTDADVTIAAPVVEVQTITFDHTPTGGGPFTITWNGMTTANIAYNAIASVMQTALRALTGAVPVVAPNGLATATVSGSAGAGFAVTMAGTFGPQALMTIGGAALTWASGNVVPTVTESVSGTITTGDLTATATGPTVAPIGSLTVINNAISGWSSVTNPAAAEVGTAIESDANLKLRRTQSLRKPGASTPQAIVAAVEEIADVTSCQVFENVTLTTDGAGRPGKSFETLVQGGADQTIADTIWAEKPAGIQTYGNQTSAVIDSQGNSQTINWSRPTALPIYVIVNLTVTSAYPVGGDEAVSNAIMAYAATLIAGSTVVPTPSMVSFLATIPGIVGATILIGTAPIPTMSSNITTTPLQIATFDPSRITVNS